MSSSENGCDVVIPYCRNNLPWLRASIESILNQVDAEFTLHLIADGFDIPNDPASDYSRVTGVCLYRNSESIGPYRTVNRLQHRFRHPYLVIQDSDDISLPHRLQYSVSELRRSGADVFSGTMRQFLSYESKPSPKLRDELARFPCLIPGTTTPSSAKGRIVNGSMTIRTSYFRDLGGYAPLPGSADTEFSARVGFANGNTVFSPEVIALRRVHSRSLSHGARGEGSVERQQWREKVQDNIRKMSQGEDPRAFGGIESEREFVSETELLSECSASPYWERRKNCRYYDVVATHVRKFFPQGGSLIDIGGGVTAGCRFLERLWEFNCTSVETKGGGFSLPGVEVVLADFEKWTAPQKYDVATCLQVIEHVPEPTEFCRKLLTLAKVLVASVPYRWPYSALNSHVNDPVDETKMSAWFGREPNESSVVTEVNGVQRLVCVYRC